MHQSKCEHLNLMGSLYAKIWGLSVLLVKSSICYMCFDTDDVSKDAVGDKLSLNSKFLQKAL